MGSEYYFLKGVLTEEQVQRRLGVTRDQLDSLRYNGLPFIKLHERRRLYFEEDLLELFKARRMTLNRAE